MSTLPNRDGIGLHFKTMSYLGGTDKILRHLFTKTVHVSITLSGIVVWNQDFPLTSSSLHCTVVVVG